MPMSQFFNVVTMSFNAMPENKIITKISEFTVFLFLSPRNGLVFTFKNHYGSKEHIYRLLGHCNATPPTGSYLR